MIKQRTIKDPVVIEGTGLQTGSRTKLNIKSGPANSGINFIRVDLPNKPLINIQSLSIENLVKYKRRTTISVGPVQIQTCEHLLAALSGLGISNIFIEIDGQEVPGMDGSAKDFTDALDRAGIIDQDVPVHEFAIDKTIWCGDKNAFLAAFPYKGLRLSYFLSYPVRSIGEQFLSIEISPEAFRRELSGARTFCMKKEALVLLALGFGRGADFNNTLVMDKNGPVKNKLRFPDEHVRHKILDLLGDLCLAGKSLNAHVVAVKSGHRLNMELVSKLKRS